jgi:hypothetical protein
VSAAPKRNLPASVRQRLLMLSQQSKQPFDLVLVRYGIEPAKPNTSGLDS